MLDDSYFEKLSLKYPDSVPKDYGVSEIEYTFDFINRVYKLDTRIEDAIKGVSNEYGLSESSFRDYLIENKYVLNNSNIAEFSKEIKKHNAKSLKKILKKHGLKTSGKRERLEQRIFENGLFGNDYYLSSKSRVFHKNKKRRIKIFDEYLFEHYYFTEFNEFYMDSYRKKEDNIPVEFINMHINKSVEDKNHRKYILNNHIMAEYFFKKDNYGKMLEHVLKIYCMNLNPVWKINDLDNHGGFSINVYDNLTFLKDVLSKNTIINMYYLVWDSFNFEKVIVPKYEGYRYLKDILNLKEYNRIILDLNKRFYENENLKIKKITQKTLFDF